MAGEPDLIVGIDVGMSCTGIAFLNKARRSNVVKVFQSWPGRRQENKVPTRLTYDMRYPNRKPLRWGFECDADNDNPMDLQVEEWFKLYLGRPGQNQERVRKLYTDYLECLYMTLYDYFSPQILNGKVWDTAVIEFVFSVPATWNTDVVDVFKNLAKDAGFGQCPRHKITASLTEPQAVAAFTLCEEKIFENEETILIVDAGGGTLDLCILKIDDKEEGRVSTTELNPVVGAEVGSTYIDTGFQKLAEAKLRPISHLLNSDVEGVAWQMRNSQAFQANKHELGKCRYDSDDCFKIKIPDLQKVITNESLGVDRGEMVFLWGELEQLFEDQVQKIKARINEVLDDLALGGRQRTMPPGKPINHVILSGGLGSSRYVQEQLDKYCRAGQHAMLRGTKLLVSTEPQLAVCRGLINHANQHVSMFPRRCARSSFGIPCRVQYGSKSGEKWREVQKVAKKEIRIKTDEFGQKWIPNCMDWFVTRGSRVCDGDRLAYRYHIKFPPGTPPNQRSCRVQVMTCLDNPPPIFKDKGGVRTQAYMEVNLSRVPERSVDKSIFKQMIGRKHHIVIEFTIEAVIGAAEVSFQCLDDTNKRNELSRPVQLELTLDQGDQTGSMSHAQLSRA